jgi:hypothetical protein
VNVPEGAVEIGPGAAPEKTAWTSNPKRFSGAMLDRPIKPPAPVTNTRLRWVTA